MVVIGARNDVELRVSIYGQHSCITGDREGGTNLIESLERFLDPLQDEVELLLGDDQRRRKADAVRPTTQGESVTHSLRIALG